MLLMNVQAILRNVLVLCVSVIQVPIDAVNFIVILGTIAKILQIYCWGVLIWATSL